MSLPTYDQLMLPLMKLLSELDRPIKISEAANILAERSELPEAELNKTLSSGKNIFKDRVSWAKTYLVKAGLIYQPKRAYCEISDLGKTIDLLKLNIITNEFLSQFDGFNDFKFGKKQEESINVKNMENIDNFEHYRSIQTPEESIEIASKELNQSVKDELLI